MGVVACHVWPKAAATRFESRQDVGAKFSEKALPPEDPIEATAPPRHNNYSKVIGERLHLARDSELSS